MLSSIDYVSIYKAALSNESNDYDLSPETIQLAIRDLIEAYRPNPNSWKEDIPYYVDYNNAAHRCAYLHKYAPLHACMVQDILSRAFSNVPDDFYETLSNTHHLNICSLGGGPGIDVVGALSAIYKEFGQRGCSAQIIDSMVGWEETFENVLEELQDGYGEFSANLSNEYFQHSFLVADLLGKWDPSVNKAIGSANLITMVKFLSSATCTETERMVENIFNSMGQGAFLLFIDNSAGGFSQLVNRLGYEWGLLSMFGPLEHELYINETIKLNKYGYTSSCKTRVTVNILMKSYATSNGLQFHLFSRNQHGLSPLRYKNNFDNEDSDSDDSKNVVEKDDSEDKNDDSEDKNDDSEEENDDSEEDYDSEEDGYDSEEEDYDSEGENDDSGENYDSNDEQDESEGNDDTDYETDDSEEDNDS